MLSNEENDPNYLPIFGHIITEKVEGADKLLKAYLKENPGYSFLVGINSKDGDFGVFYPANSRVEDWIYSHEKSTDLRKYLSKNGRVSAVKLRGVISDGMYLDIKTLLDLNSEIDVDKIVPGVPIATVQKKDASHLIIGRRYVIESNKESRKPSQERQEGYSMNLNFEKTPFRQAYRILTSNRLWWRKRLWFLKNNIWALIAHFFAILTCAKPISIEQKNGFLRHKDTAFVERDLESIQNLFIEKNEPILITNKMHGTSHRLAFLRVKEKFLFGKDCTRVKVLHGTRNVILGEHGGARTDSYYKDDFRQRAFSRSLIETMKLFAAEHNIDIFVYGELVGYQSNGKPIMNGGSFQKPASWAINKNTGKYEYSYGCETGQCKFYLYNVFFRNADGEEVHDPYLVGVVQDLFSTLNGSLWVQENTFTCPDTAGFTKDWLEKTKERINIQDPLVRENEVPYPFEGIIVKIGKGEKARFWKLKSNAFKIEEGLLQDKGIAEEVENEG